MLKEVTNFFTMVRLPYSLVGFRGFSSKDRKVGRWGDWEKLLVPLTICETQIKSCYLWLKALMLFDCICCKFPLKYEKSGTKLKNWNLKDQIKKISHEGFHAQISPNWTFFYLSFCSHKNERNIPWDNHRLQHPTAYTHVMRSITGSQRGLKLI